MNKKNRFPFRKGEEVFDGIIHFLDGNTDPADELRRYCNFELYGLFTRFRHQIDPKHLFSLKDPAFEIFDGLRKSNRLRTLCYFYDSLPELFIAELDQILSEVGQIIRGNPDHPLNSVTLTREILRTALAAAQDDDSSRLEEEFGIPEPQKENPMALPEGTHYGITIVFLLFIGLCLALIYGFLRRKRIPSKEFSDFIRRRSGATWEMKLCDSQEPSTWSLRKALKQVRLSDAELGEALPQIADRFSYQLYTPDFGAPFDGRKMMSLGAEVNDDKKFVLTVLHPGLEDKSDFLFLAKVTLSTGDRITHDRLLKLNSDSPLTRVFSDAFIRDGGDELAASQIQAVSHSCKDDRVFDQWLLDLVNCSQGFLEIIAPEKGSPLKEQEVTYVNRDVLIELHHGVVRRTVVRGVKRKGKVLLKARIEVESKEQ